MWLINIVPPIVLFFFLYPKQYPEIFAGLGFASGICITVVLLSVIFFLKKADVGIFLNIILLSFIFIGYLLPMFDDNSPSVIISVIVGFLAWLGVGFSSGALIYYPLAKSRGIFSKQLPSLFKDFLLIPGQISVLAIFVAIIAKTTHVLKFSSAFIYWQILSWSVLLIVLHSVKRDQKVDFNAIRKYIIEEKQLIIRLRKQTILLMFFLFMAISTIFEAFRGLWLLWFGTAIWITLVFASVWKIWRYVFDVPEAVSN